MIIYALTDPNTGDVRYVGMTSRPVVERVIEHVQRTNRMMHCASWVAGLVRVGQEPGWLVLDKCGDDWVEREMFWISHFRSIGCNLTNLTDGGEGTLGQKHTEAAIAKIRKARATQKNVGHRTDSGWHHSAASRERISVAARCQVNRYQLTHQDRSRGGTSRIPHLADARALRATR